MEKQQQQQQQNKPIAADEQKLSESESEQATRVSPAAVIGLKAILAGTQISLLTHRQLKEMVSVMGNSAVSAMLKSAGSSPETFSFNCPSADCVEEKVNQIKTVPPELFEAPELSRCIDRPWEAYYPGNICERAVPAANDAEFNGMLLMTNDEI